MSKLKLTPWFPGHVKPTRPGVYQQKNINGKLGYRLWDGECWFLWNQNAHLAADCWTPTGWAFQNEPWRGLASRDGK